MSEQITPDTKDWTRVLDEPCDQCGIDVRALGTAQVAALVRGASGRFAEVLGSAGSGLRPSPMVWSPHEYCVHVAQMYEVMAKRLALMLAQEAPAFANWDQDAAAVANDYASIPALEVARMLEEASLAFAGALEALTDAQIPRMGTRSNGAVFTTATLAQYAWHDAAHHLHHDLGVARFQGRSSRRAPGRAQAAGR